MSTTPNSETDSNIVRAYDEAITRAQVDPNAPDSDHTRFDNGSALTTFGQENIQASNLEHSIGRGVPEEDFGPGEELRDREFPVPAETTLDRNRNVPMQPHAAPSAVIPPTGQDGTEMGDRQFGATVPSIMDQREVAPDLVQEQR